MYSRYIALAVFIVLTVVIGVSKGSWRQKLTTYGMAFVEGMVGGLIIDSVGVNAGYYYFPRQPIYSLSYFGIVVPCWGVFGLLANYLWTKLGSERFIKGLSVTLPALFTFYEGSNLLTGSWVYTIPFYWVALGWMPLVLTFVGCHRRRAIVEKVADLERRTEEKSAKRYALYGLRIMIIVVMFPLLVTSLARLLVEFSKLRRANIGVRQYVKALLLMS